MGDTDHVLVNGLCPTGPIDAHPERNVEEDREATRNVEDNSTTRMSGLEHIEKGPHCLPEMLTFGGKVPLVLLWNSGS